MSNIPAILIFQHEVPQKAMKLETIPPSALHYVEVDMREGKETKLPEGQMPGIVIFNCDQFNFTTMLRILQFKSKLGPETITLLFAPFSITAMEFALQTGITEFISQPVTAELLQTIVQRKLHTEFLWDF